MKDKKVIVAMSGGVDSSVAAALLKRNGYNVVGVFMKFWTPRVPRDKPQIENRCCSLEAQTDARKVAAKLNIPFYVIDVRKEFKKRVVDYFVSEYEKGNTPNPCVMCNKYIKFKFLLKKLLELDADFVATGHYARNGLYVAKDKAKDQTYFLWTLKQAQLKRILFPIGDFIKGEVRELAKKFDLPVFQKKESQEICFINTNIYEFLKSRLSSKALAKGEIITTDGKVVGEHKGLYLYTIGQRKGIKIGGMGPASTRVSSLGGPFYVVKKDFKKNALIVAQSDFNEALFKKEMKIKKVNWIDKIPFRCKVKIRYLSDSVPCTIKGNKVIFDKKQRAVTPGQSAVFYSSSEALAKEDKGNKVLGGGIIM